MIVKICGITNLNDANMAADLGADALGFIFVPSSPRYIPPEKAAAITAHLPESLVRVGVFVNAGRREILETVEKAGVNCLQLHGDESPDDVKDFTLPVWKAFRISDRFDPQELDAYSAEAYLLDTFSPDSYGGTGRTFDWNIARRLNTGRKIILSGGLNPENIARAVEYIRPYGVDVNSGVEQQPGKKNAELLRRLFVNIRNVQAE
jgi:phosphoribosylanthranilate isomerase